MVLTFGWSYFASLVATSKDGMFQNVRLGRCLRPVVSVLLRLRSIVMFHGRLYQAVTAGTEVVVAESHK